MFKMNSWSCRQRLRSVPSCDIDFCYNLEKAWWINFRVKYEDVITVDEIYGKYQEQYFNIYNNSNYKNIICI